MNVNYHMHTTRCHHAFGTEEEYILAAIQAGFKEVGFADHSPWPFENGYVSRMRMTADDLADYVDVISNLREKYKDQISIKIGLECEYFPSMMDWLKEAIEEQKLDYIILGHHFSENETQGKYYGSPTFKKTVLERYVGQVKEAIQTGLFSYVAHPDVIDYVTSHDKHYKKYMTELCQCAKEHDIPLEFNLLGYGDKRHYPNPDFWKIASQVGNKVIIGFDAHAPISLLNTSLYKQARDYLESLHMNIVEEIKFFR